MDTVPFDKQKHIRYWLRCFKTLLPTHYESTDSNRMFLAFMVLSSLDILDILHSSTISSEERSDAIDWIYNCQHPSGGFRAFPGTKVGTSGSPASAHLDAASISGTSFALASLIVLRDGLERVDREGCLKLVRGLQAGDGGFAEVMGQQGAPEGRRDVRHGYFAMATLYVLGHSDLSTRKPRPNLEALRGSIYATQNYDGGIGGMPGEESHGGYAYCAVGALKIVEQMNSNLQPQGSKERFTRFIDRLLPNLVHRQVAWTEPESESESESESYKHDDVEKQPGCRIEDHIPLEAVDVATDLRWIGFDGRCNKPADTCYTFWVGGTLAMLGLSDELIAREPHRRFLLEQTQHRIGGFGKTPGDPPDALHSFMGLLALSLMHEDGLEPVDALFAITRTARIHLEDIRRPTTERYVRE